MVKRRCCQERDQSHGFRSVKVLKFDTPPGSPKNCPEAKAEVLSKSRSAQSSQVVHWVLAKSSSINQLLIDIEHCELACLNSTWNLG
ncbi:hypothetical protein Bca4012_030402 [Brassica carinata]